TALGALGMSAAAVKAVAQSLETFGQGSPPAAAMREMKGTGGALFVQQLKAAGVEHVFFNPSTGDYPIFDALVDGPVGWKRHVYNRGARGAKWTPGEADTVISYLVPNCGPVAPAANAAALPGGAGKELVESRCVACHSLERVTVVKRQKRDWERVVANMYERWGMSAPDEVNAISAYLIAQFGRE